MFDILQGPIQKKLGLGEIFAKRKQNFTPTPLGTPRGGARLNYKFKTFGFLYTSNVHIQSNYLTCTNFSPSNKQTSRKKTANFFYVIQFQI